MTRANFAAVMMAAFLTSAAVAQEQLQPSNKSYFGEVSGAVDGACPEDISGAHGAGLHHRSHPPRHWGLAYASGYPDGILNYGHPSSACDYKGPGICCQTCANGQCHYRYYGCPDLFYNYYAWPSCSNVGAQLYVCPRPVPPLVGHTYITYQPLMPHEFMYEHGRTYHRYYNGGQGLNRTCVHWWHSPLDGLLPP